MKGFVVGIDEVGRGALAGPVVVGAVADYQLETLLPALLDLLRIPVIRDSKKLTRMQREKAYTFLEGRLTWSVGVVESTDIDEQGLAWALRAAATDAINGLECLVQEVVADAGLFHNNEERIPTKRFVKGDEHFSSIALASIMAKVWRDRQMLIYDTLYPEYGFAQHVGYGTAKHRQVLQNQGVTDIHRRSFLSSFLT